MSRILIAHNFSEFSYADTSRELALSLAESGAEVWFISHQPAFPAPWYPHKRLKVLSWSQSRPDGLQSILQAIQWIRSFKPSAVLAHSAATNAIILAAFLCGVPVRLAYYHSAYEANLADNPASGAREKWIRWRKSIFLRLATKVICVSEFARQDGLKWFGISMKRSVRVYNSLSLSDATPMPFKTAPTFTYGSLNRLEKCKLLPGLIEGFTNFAIQSSPKPMLEIAGAGTLEQWIVEATAANPSIQYRGLLPYNAIGTFINQQDFVLFSTIADAFGMVIIECYRWGTVPIASASGALPEIIEDGVTGYLVPGIAGNTWEEVLKHSAQYGPNTEVYNKMVQAGWTKLQSLFDRSQQLDQLISLLHNEL